MDVARNLIERKKSVYASPSHVDGYFSTYDFDIPGIHAQEQSGGQHRAAQEKKEFTHRDQKNFKISDRTALGPKILQILGTIRTNSRENLS